MGKLPSRAIVVAWITIVFSPVAAHAAAGFVNDNNVRMRELPSLSGKILGTYGNGTPVVTLGSAPSTDASLADYDWVKVSINNLVGWIYGEFISYPDRAQGTKPHRISNFVEGSVKKIGSDARIYVGMKSSTLTDVLGSPSHTAFDEEDNNVTWEYLREPGLKILVNRTLDRVVHLILTGPGWSLGSGTKVGDPIERVIEATPSGSVSGSMFYSDLDIGNRAGFYHAGVIVTYDEKSKQITAIQIGTPE